MTCSNTSRAGLLAVTFHLALTTEGTAARVENARFWRWAGRSTVIISWGWLQWWKWRWDIHRVSSEMIFLTKQEEKKMREITDSCHNWMMDGWFYLPWPLGALTICSLPGSLYFTIRHCHNIKSCSKLYTEASFFFPFCMLSFTSIQLL